jgi:hypothetical protein
LFQLNVLFLHLLLAFIYFFVICCIIGCRIPSHDILAEKYETKTIRLALYNYKHQHQETNRIKNEAKEHYFETLIGLETLLRNC